MKESTLSEDWLQPFVRQAEIPVYAMQLESCISPDVESQRWSLFSAPERIDPRHVCPDPSQPCGGGGVFWVHCSAAEMLSSTALTMDTCAFAQINFDDVMQFFVVFTELQKEPKLFMMRASVLVCRQA
jgi:hypothetical protein